MKCISHQMHSNIWKSIRLDKELLYSKTIPMWSALFISVQSIKPHSGNNWIL